MWYKFFKSWEEVEVAFRGNFVDYIFSGSFFIWKVKLMVIEEVWKEIVWDSVSVDVVCSGNFGVMEY